MRHEPVESNAVSASCPSGAPIGVFDSGVGGLTVAREIARALPSERILYIADQAHVPYGPRPLEEVRSFATRLSAHLFAEGAKAVVMACNISSATALEEVARVHGGERAFGVIGPGARAAIAASSRAKVGVLATAGTVATRAYTRTLESLAPVEVVEVACPEFVPLVESRSTSGEAARRAARAYLEPILRAGADTVVLGCTHYPYLLPVLEEVAGPAVTFIDPARATVDALAASLAARGLAATGERARPHGLYTTGDAATFAAQVSSFWPLGQVDASVSALSWSAIDGASAALSPRG